MAQALGKSNCLQDPLLPLLEVAHDRKCQCCLTVSAYGGIVTAK